MRAYFAPYIKPVQPGESTRYDGEFIVPFSSKRIPFEAAGTLHKRQRKTGPRMFTLKQVPTEKGMQMLRELAYKNMPRQRRPASPQQLGSVDLVKESTFHLDPQTQQVLRGETITTSKRPRVRRKYTIQIQGR
jgi:hypothetical protein